MRINSGSQRSGISPMLIWLFSLTPYLCCWAQQPAPTGNSQSPPVTLRGNVANNNSADNPDVSPQQQSANLVPDSPGAIKALPSPAASEQSPTLSTYARLQEQSPGPQEPLGTAAAESAPTTGVAASRPAGAALAPAKQRRVRSILIRVGVVVGIGAAVGTVVALSEASPSRPPGTH